jgi:hypothetical protein
MNLSSSFLISICVVHRSKRHKIFFNTNSDINTANWNERMKKNIKFTSTRHDPVYVKHQFYFGNLSGKLKWTKLRKKNCFARQQKKHFSIISVSSHRHESVQLWFSFPSFFFSCDNFIFDTFHKKFLSYPWRRRKKM